MFTRAIPSLMQIRLSICPKLEAAAVCTNAVWPSLRMVSTMPRAVSGLTNDEAPSAAVAPAGSSRHCSSGTQRYCEYIAPPSAATVLPSRACAAGADPASTTTPAPSLPIGMDTSKRAAMLFNAASGTWAATSGSSLVPRWLALVMSAPANRSPRSEGLMGAASIRMSTSLAAGTGMGTWVRDTSRSPLLLTSDRSCKPVRASDGVMVLRVAPGESNAAHATPRSEWWPDATIRGMNPPLVIFGSGLLAGAMNALAGGGTFVALPALISVGVPSVQANASSTVGLFPGTAASAWAYRDGLAPIGAVSLRSLLFVTVLGGAFGAWLLLSTPSTTFDSLLPWLLLIATLTLTFGKRLGEALPRRL